MPWYRIDMVALLASTLLGMSQTPQTLQRTTTVPVEGSYLLYLPSDYETNSKRYPLMLFLHGAGERGKDLERIKVHGPPKEIGKGRNLPFIVVAPQCPGPGFWEIAMLIGLLDEVEKKYRVDKEREYVTGLSMGGLGTYELAARQPKRFAAIAPICGWADPAIAPKIRNLPIWSTHGDKDQAVPLSMEQPLVDALKALGADVRFDVIPGGEHDVWTDVYGGEAIYSWLLEHKRRS